MFAVKVCTRKGFIDILGDVVPFVSGDPEAGTDVGDERTEAAAGRSRAREHGASCEPSEQQYCK